MAYVLLPVHAVLLAFGVLAPAGFLNADRADQRIRAIQRFLEAFPDTERVLDTVARQGIFFDYGLHALVMSVGGRVGLIVVQVALAVVAALCVSSVALRVFRSRSLAIAAGLVYGLLPQSLAFPHQLLTESLANPMLVIGLALFVRVLEEPRRLAPWLAAGLAFGVAGAVRPALSLVPMVALGLLALLHWRAAVTKGAAVFVVASGALLVAWSLFMWAQTGRFGLGESGQDLGLNFSDSVTKVLLREGVTTDGKPPEWLPVRLSLPEYLEFVRQYPFGFANLYFMNVFVMTADSGIGRLYVDLLGLGAEARLKLQDPVVGWRAQLTNHGVMAMLREGFAVAPGTIVAGSLGGLAFAFVNLGVLVAYVGLLSQARLWLGAAGVSMARQWCVAFLLLIPLYVIATSQVVAYAPSRHRSQGEFAWALLTCVGWAFLWQWRSRRALLVRWLTGDGHARE